MKVLFVIPPALHYIEASASERVDRSREHRPNLGILYVASYLEKMRPRHQVAIIDAASECYSLEQLGKLIQQYKPDVVGITALTFTLLDALTVARIVKHMQPKTWVVLGGWHPTYFPMETLKQQGVDVVVMREGEITFAELCDRLADDLVHPALNEVAGLAYRDQAGDTIINPPRRLISNLDELTPPNYHLLNIKNYTHVLGKSPVTLALQSSRGCPFGCMFCDIRRSPFRQRTTESVVAEIRHWHDLGIRSFFLTDDNFVLNKEWTLKTCEAIARNDLHIDFKISARVDLPDSEMYQALKRAGCSRVNFGVESSRQDYLDYLNKGTTVSEIATAFRLAHQAGLKAFAYMIVGFPLQTKQEMFRELLFLQRIKADYATFAVLSPYPQTALYKRLLKAGDLAFDFWQDFAEHPRDDFVMPTVSQKYSREHLRHTQVRLTQMFYFNPLFLGRTIQSVRSFEQLKNLARMGINMAIGAGRDKS